MYHLVIIVFGVYANSVHSVDMNTLAQCLVAKAKIERLSAHVSAECLEK